MADIKYLTLDDVVAIQEAILERMEASESPLLDREKLESALGRCRNVAHYEWADLIRQSVTLAVAISQSQAFLDGNKRAAFGAADTFLCNNGLVFQGIALKIAEWLEAVGQHGSRRTRGHDRPV